MIPPAMKIIDDNRKILEVRTQAQGVPHLLGLLFLGLPVAGDGVEQSLPQDVNVVSQGQPEK